jgi:hypothetical protein
MELIDTLFNEKIAVLNDNINFNQTYKKCLDEKPKLILEEYKSTDEKCQVTNMYTF